MCVRAPVRQLACASTSAPSTSCPLPTAYCLLPAYCLSRCRAGPVEAALFVFDDFFSYRNGVYRADQSSVRNEDGSSACHALSHGPVPLRSPPTGHANDQERGAPPPPPRLGASQHNMHNMHARALLSMLTQATP